MTSFDIGRRHLIGCVATAALAGCSTFGPPRTPPAMTPPERYSLAPTPATLPGSGVGAGSARQQLAVGAPMISDWWRAYRNPELDALVSEALAHSPSLAAARARLTSAHELLRASIGNSEYPSLDLEGIGARASVPKLPFLPQGNSVLNVFAAGFQAQWKVDLFGASTLSNRSSAGQLREQEYEYLGTRRSLATNVVLAVITASSQDAQLQAQQRWAAFAEQRAAQTRARYAMGSASRFDMLSDEESAAEAAREIPALRQQLLVTRHAEAVLLGRTPDEAPLPLALDSLHLPDRLPVSVPSELLHQRPDILAAEAAVRATADAAGAAKASLYPSLTLSAALSRTGSDWSTLSGPGGAAWLIGGALAQPLFHGGALRAKARSAQADYQAAVAQYRQIVLSAFQAVADDLVALEEDADQLEQARRAADALDGMQQALAQRFDAGSAPLFEVLATREQFQSARIQYVAARAARLTDSAALLDAMGEANPRLAAW